jgi:hypothetical protein
MTISKVVHVIVWVLAKGVSNMRGHAPHEVGAVSIGDVGRDCRGWARWMIVTIGRKALKTVVEMLHGRGAKWETIIDVPNRIVVRVFCVISVAGKTTFVDINEGLRGVILAWRKSSSGVV